MTIVQGTKVNDLLALNWRVVEDNTQKLGGPVLMADPIGQHWSVGPDGVITSVTPTPKEQPK